MSLSMKIALLGFLVLPAAVGCGTGPTTEKQPEPRQVATDDDSRRVLIRETAIAVLSAKQRKAWTTLLGEPI